LAALILGSAGATATAASGGGSAASTTVAGHIDLAQLAPASQSVGWGSFLTDKTPYHQHWHAACLSLPSLSEECGLPITMQL
jgi:hypothetical protein